MKYIQQHQECLWILGCFPLSSLCCIPCGNVCLLQLGKCLKEYESLSERFADLYQSAFDADSFTLNSILLYPSVLVSTNDHLNLYIVFAFSLRLWMILLKKLEFALICHTAYSRAVKSLSHVSLHSSEAVMQGTLRIHCHCIYYIYLYKLCTCIPYDYKMLSIINDLSNCYCYYWSSKNISTSMFIITKI